MLKVKPQATDKWVRFTDGSQLRYQHRVGRVGSGHSGRHLPFRPNTGTQRARAARRHFVKSLEFIAQDPKGLLQPAIKCSGR
jgi:hypothetical protein